MSVVLFSVLCYTQTLGHVGYVSSQQPVLVPPVVTSFASGIWAKVLPSPFHANT